MAAYLLPVAVCLFGGLGASCRYAVDTTIKTYWKHAFPLSTFTINVVAGLLAGVVAALALAPAGASDATSGIAPMIDESWRLMLATGFLGGFSTFSTAINEMATLFKTHRYPTAVGYLTASVIAPVFAAAAGFLLIV